MRRCCCWSSLLPSCHSPCLAVLVAPKQVGHSQSVAHSFARSLQSCCPEAISPGLTKNPHHVRVRPVQRALSRIESILSSSAPELCQSSLLLSHNLVCRPLCVLPLSNSLGGAGWSRICNTGNSADLALLVGFLILRRAIGVGWPLFRSPPPLLSSFFLDHSCSASYKYLVLPWCAEPRAGSSGLCRWQWEKVPRTRVGPNGRASRDPQLWTI